MPKIRGIHPDIWTDEDFVELSPLARLLWVGMWNYACDNGHLRDRSKQIKMRVLPTDDVNVAELLRELETNGRITRSDGWVTIPNFTKRQKPDKRFWVVCEAPGCTKPGDPERETRSAPHEPTQSHHEPTSGALGDVDGEGDGEGELRVTTAPRKRPSTRLPDDWQPTESHWERRHDGIDVQREADTFRAHAEANDRRAVNWNAAFTQWLLKAKPSPASQPHKGRAAQWLDLTRQLGNQQGPPRPEIGPSA
jgi:hypothetical protein